MTVIGKQRAWAPLDAPGPSPAYIDLRLFKIV